jgi:hypothetical protein
LIAIDVRLAEVWVEASSGAACDHLSGAFSREALLNGQLAELLALWVVAEVSEVVDGEVAVARCWVRAQKGFRQNAALGGFQLSPQALNF